MNFSDCIHTQDLGPRKPARLLSCMGPPGFLSPGLGDHPWSPVMFLNYYRGYHCKITGQVTKAAPPLCPWPHPMNIPHLPSLLANMLRLPDSAVEPYNLFGRSLAGSLEQAGEKCSGSHFFGLYQILFRCSFVRYTQIAHPTNTEGLIPGHLSVSGKA